MHNSLFILPDGTEISSGVGKIPAIQSVSYTHAVNADTDLMYGAACAAMLEATLLDTSGSFSVKAGDEIVCYDVDESGNRTLVGHFLLETPTKPSANTYKLTAYDRMILLDKDLSQWLAALSQWPYSMNALLAMVCAECGIAVAGNTELVNGDFPVKRFLQNVTGRQLVQWIAGANGTYAQITPEGRLSFGAYTDGGELELSVKSLKLFDYATAPVERVVIKQAEDDVGVSWPENSTGETYAVMGNPLLAAFDPAELLPYAENLYNAVAGISYTPSEIQVYDPEGSCRPGAFITVADRYGKPYRTVVFSVTRRGGLSILKSTGNSSRESASAIAGMNNVKVIQGRVARLKADLQGVSSDLTLTKIALDAVEEEQSLIRQEVDEINLQVSHTVKNAVLHPKITGQYSPMVEVEDALANSVKGLRVYGKTVQSGTPAPESPVPLVSVGNGGSISVKLDPNGQLLAISTPNGLPGMPLGATIPDAIASSKAHLSCVWWDEGEKQYYLSDYRDYGQAVDTQVLYIYTCTGASDEYWGLSGTNAYKGMDPSKAKATPAIGTHMPVTIAQSYGTVYCDISRVNAATIDEWKAWLASQYAAGTPMQIMYVLETPIVTPIPEAELAAFRALSNEAGQLTVSSEANLYLELAGIASGASVEDAAAAAGAAQDTANQAKADAATAQGTADNAGAAADAVRQELIAQSAAMNLRADGLEVSVTAVRGVLDEKADRSQVSEITEHFHFGADGMTIYNSANGMGIGISETRVVFTGGEDSETIIRPADMETANLRIGRRLDLGAFSLIPRTNGNLSLRYTGGKT